MADPLIGIIMGSTSDWETMRHAAETLEGLGVVHETRVVSAHRTPDRLYDYARTAKERGLKAIIAGAGGAAHLPGMAASMTELPVLGVPIESQALRSIYRNSDKIHTTLELTATGIIVIQTSTDQDTAAALQQHASEVTDFVNEGMAAMHRAMMRNGGGMMHR